eukprot:s2312_g5.t1
MRFGSCGSILSVAVFAVHRGGRFLAFRSRYSGSLDGLITWFEIWFSACHKPISFCTGPESLPTCWKQTRRALISQHRSGDFLSLRYEILKELGSGSFGVVHLVRERATGLERVIKIVTTKNLAPRLLDNMRREIQVLQDLDHPNLGQSRGCV